MLECVVLHSSTCQAIGLAHPAAVGCEFCRDAAEAAGGVMDMPGPRGEGPIGGPQGLVGTALK